MPWVSASNEPRGARSSCARFSSPARTIEISGSRSVSRKKWGSLPSACATRSSAPTVGVVWPRSISEMWVADSPAAEATWRRVRLRSRRTVRMRRPISPLRMSRSSPGLEPVLRAGGHEHAALAFAGVSVGMGAGGLEVERIARREHVVVLADPDLQLPGQDVDELLALVGVGRTERSDALGEGLEQDRDFRAGERARQRLGAHRDVL